MPLEPDFLAVLRCPVSRARLVDDGVRLVAVDPRGRRAYRVEDDSFPMLIAEEATTLDEAEWREVMRRAGEPVGS